MTEQEALNWIADIFQEPADRLTPETRREQINTWDSMGVLVLMAGMDEQFNVVMSDEEMVDMHCVDDILAVLRKNHKLTGAR
ncbi:MAG: acyl carrier protein [Verrucomicrobiales bacterium]